MRNIFQNKSKCFLGVGKWVDKIENLTFLLTVKTRWAQSAHPVPTTLYILSSNYFNFKTKSTFFSESDKDQDRLISFDEFLAETKKDEFEQDPGWETMDQEEDNEIFSDEEFRAYQAQRDREIQGMINRGQVPPGKVF